MTGAAVVKCGRWPTLLALVALAGCGEPLEKQSEVTKLRLLAVAADPPSAPPGEALALSALWSDPFGGVPDFTWTSCPAEPTEPDRCTEEESAIDEGRGLDEIFFLMPDVPALLVRLRICAEEACDPGIEAIKRVEASSSGAPNTNPVITSFEVGGTNGSGLPTAEVDEEVTVALEAAAGSAETRDGTTEELIVSWFATGGDFDEERTMDPDDETSRFEVAWTAPSDPGSVTMWAVLRDGEGGVSWREARVAVE